MEYNVAIVDDHTLIAKALSGIIEHFPRYKVLYEVEHGRALMEKFKSPRNIPDIVLLDISMPVMDGFETAAWLKEHHPSVLVMALSMQSDDLSLIKMLRAGARGYLLKNIYPADFEKALNALVANGYYYPDWASHKIFASMSGEEKEIVITDREREFLEYSCSEMTYKEIGEKMNCSNRTVEGYRDALFAKLDLKTRVGLAVYAIKSGIHKL